MTRNRAETAAPVLPLVARASSAAQPPATRTISAPTPDVHVQEPPPASSTPNSQLPTIRLIPHQDTRANRPSLVFPSISRTLPSPASVIRVGRYSERDSTSGYQNEPNPGTPSSAPVGFKSKVVSRRHCEFWCTASQWYIKDVGSSSGTFLNHIRLSQPGVESKPYAVNDGDVVQLGIDFRGGEEMIFRCVKIRVECNRGWQKGLNTFNKSTHKRLRNLAKSQPKKDSDAASTHTSECSICLMSIAPCQSLFVAPCSHVWHYKCIRPILNGSTWPNFLCPNCRAVADLEADVEEEDIDWSEDEDVDKDPDMKRAIEESLIDNGKTNGAARTDGEGEPIRISLRGVSSNNPNETSRLADSPDPDEGEATILASAIPVSIRNGINRANTPNVLSPTTVHNSHEDGRRGSAAEIGGPDCPMTPRNDAGPFILDGSAGRG
ncbi:SMAD/FHA domain-containing protein [Rhizodiscina lignyota]|uniref:RING-type E3 ubiquitin transferase n=1 Tax=Rhizodiscina lignyota TaxID=1504668 RepID=A0A9P4IT49_9PEZI|nr:SMAD/FHA domain-containing protein [Rhizodiscina lignyota]